MRYASQHPEEDINVKVFISWSGDRSKQIAMALKEWLPEVLQDAEAWMSAHDISAGARWAGEVGEQLQESHYGILCLTPDNLAAPWLIFEAGALSKVMDKARVVPYLTDLALTDVGYPLAQFQGVTSDRDGTLRLLQGMNEIRSSPMEEARLARVFEKWWPDLEASMRRSASKAVPTKARPERELLEEVLTQVRTIARDSSKLVQAMPRLLGVTGDSAIKHYWIQVDRHPSGEGWEDKCSNCGTVMNYDPRHGERLPGQCPKCGEKVTMPAKP